MSKQSNIIVEQAVLGADPATPVTNRSVIYPKSDGEWYVLNSDATIKKVTSQDAFAAVTRTKTTFTATAAQTAFTVPAYTLNQGLVDVIYNGSYLAPAEFTETNSTTVTLTTGADETGDVVEIITYKEAGVSSVTRGRALAYAIALG